MTDVDEAVVAPLEMAFATLPGGVYPLGRAMWGAAIGGAVAYGVRPSVSFDAHGQARPWIVTDPNNPEAAIFPAAAFVILPAVVGGLFL